MGLACVSPFEKVSSQPDVSPPVSGETQKALEIPNPLCAGPTSSMVTASLFCCLSLQLQVQQVSPAAAQPMNTRLNSVFIPGGSWTADLGPMSRTNPTVFS